jgi:hypothetical protein
MIVLYHHGVKMNMVATKRENETEVDREAVGDNASSQKTGNLKWNQT